ncbi:MAG: HAD hydrolase-like protein [Proteiniphilum sp.]|uniref:HAD family hydrolase n=1 Tax=Proteiniphilum sp. TaxID=1926877 RepID=UPI002B1F8240|nr:HAD hydrolase-like protein [Proteiniphilum sp.]MEA5129151.1 HAD hydrolase-like protein [Proteiniphilum sp.]
MIEILTQYLQKNHFSHFDLKAVIFDMDGVLYDSMPAHAESWQQTMEGFGYTSTKPLEFYYHEGRIGSSTINIITEREFGRKATEKEIKKIYARKSELFAQYNQGKIIPGIKEIIKFVKSQELKPVLVTGSGQPSLLDRLDTHFPGVFTPETMVTAFDVEHGKPDPQPYLMGLQKGGALKPNQAIVIENAPLGIESAIAAGIFTIAVNTGPLPDSVLTDAGASIVLNSMEALLETMPEIVRLTQTITI